MINREAQVDLGKQLYGSSIKNEKYCDEEMKYRNPGKVDETLWEKAKKLSMKSYGELRWPFITSMYEKLGGTFK